MELPVSLTESKILIRKQNDIITVLFKGIMVGVWKGVIRTMRISNYEHIRDLIPIDMSVNLIITAAWDAATDIT